jgi:hypothetical protein
MPTVWIVNQSNHDFAEAANYGEIKYLSKGSMNRYAVNNIARQFEEILKDSKPEDWLVPCALNVMNIIASAILSTKHGKLNLLLYKKGVYLERNLVF